MEALAPPRRDQQPRRGGVALNRTVGGHPLPRCEADGQAVGQRFWSSTEEPRGYES